MAPSDPGSKRVGRKGEKIRDADAKDEDWERMRVAVLKGCKLKGTIKITALSDRPTQEANKTVSLDKTQRRLDMLEAQLKAEIQGEVVEVSEQEYIDLIEKLKDEITVAWENTERVTALKRAIQCAKMLGDTRVPQFYPAMFVLISGILDQFGKLVFARIKRRSLEVAAQEEGRAVKLPPNFTSADIRTEAKETCRNWFYKIACIRELLPRIYIEMALLTCYRFLADDEFGGIVTRISHMIRGIGDPLAVRPRFKPVIKPACMKRASVL